MENEYYERISARNFYSINDDKIRIEDYVIKLIKPKFDIFDIFSTTRFDSKAENPTYISAGKHIDSIIYRFEIYQCRDEWFYTIMLKYDSDEDNFDPTEKKYYKCDQIDGLVKCIDDNLNER